MEIRENILKDKRKEALERDRPTHYSSKIGYFNANWTNHHRLLVDDVKNHYLSYSRHIQYSITLQTRLIIKRDKFRSEQQLISLQEDFWHFKNRINYHFYGKTGHRKPHIYSLLILPVIEGSAFSPEGERTLHYHLGLGNIPDEASFNELCIVIRKHWLKTKFGTDMIRVKSADPDWMDYITKEVDRGNIDCVDWRNASIPHEALHI